VGGFDGSSFAKMDLSGSRRGATEPGKIERLPQVSREGSGFFFG
jgi:hypothetical protein